MPLARRFRWLARIVVYPALLVGLALGVQQLTGNIHAVEPGVLYRSAQLNETQLRATIERYGIRTIVNLRGSNPGRDWYDTERRVSQELSVAHVDLGLSSDRVPDDAVVGRLLDTLRGAVKPVLIHCGGGADRSGLAAALYAHAVMRSPFNEASRQLSLRYGHFPWLWSETGAMDRAFTRFVARTHNAQSRAIP